MLLLNVLRKVAANWKNFCSLSVCYLLINTLVMIPVAGAAAWKTGSWLADVTAAGATPVAERAVMAGSSGGALDFVAVAVVVGALALGGFLVMMGIAMGYAGLVSGVAAFARGEQVSMALCLREGWEHRMRFVGLLLLGLPLLAAAIAAGQMAVGPGPQWVVKGLTAVLLVNLGFYPAYLLVTERVGVLEAVGHGLRLFLHRPAEAALSGLLWVAFDLVGSAMAKASSAMFFMPNLVSMILLAVVLFLFSTFQQVLQMSYFAERFDTIIRSDVI